MPGRRGSSSYVSVPRLPLNAPPGAGLDDAIVTGGGSAVADDAGGEGDFFFGGVVLWNTHCISSDRTYFFSLPLSVPAAVYTLTGFGPPGVLR